MRTDSSTSRSLFNGLVRQSEGAWEQFCEIYSPLIARWCLRKGLPVEDAKEIVQQVHFLVFRNVDEFTYSRPGATFRGWLFRITHNQAVNVLRLRNREPLLNDEQLSALETPANAEDVVDMAGLIYRTLHLPDQFTDLNRRVFVDHFFEQKSREQIAEEQGLTAGAVRAHINRTAKRLKDLLSPEFPDLSGDSDVSGH